MQDKTRIGSGRRNRWLVGLAGWFGLMAAACVSVDPRSDFQRVAEQVREATGQEVVPVTVTEEEVKEHVERLLSAGLSAESSAALCLLNNPKLSAVYDRVGLARADVVQSQLWRNPTLVFSVRFPDGGGLVNLMGDFAQNIAELWQIPVRTRSAESTLEQTVLESARELGVAVLDAKAAYYKAYAADRLREISQENLRIAQDSRELAVARLKVGAGTEIESNLAQSEVLDAELATRSAALAAFEARSELAVMLGVTLPPDRLRLAEVLPEAPQEALSSEMLVAAAERNRADLAAARKLVEAAQADWLLERRRVFPELELGLSVEREARAQSSDGNPVAKAIGESVASGGMVPPGIGSEEDAGQDVLIGPSLGLELPFFDQNQVGIAKARYRLLQSIRLAESLRRQLIQEVQGARERMRVAADNMRFFRDQVLPLRETNLELTREGYRVGKTAFLAVLESQRVLLAARARHVELQQTAALDRIELEKATGMPWEKIRAAQVENVAAPGP